MDEFLESLRKRIEDLQTQREQAKQAFHQIEGALFEAKKALGEAIKTAPKEPVEVEEVSE